MNKFSILLIILATVLGSLQVRAMQQQDKIMEELSETQRKTDVIYRLFNDIDEIDSVSLCDTK